ncbi:hypothetical protein ACSSVY_001937 [Roseovarius sp. MBR-51]
MDFTGVRNDLCVPARSLRVTPPRRNPRTSRVRPAAQEQQNAGSRSSGLSGHSIRSNSKDYARSSMCRLAILIWLDAMTPFNVSAQTALPNRSRARGCAISLVVFFGSMLRGSLVLGLIAASTSVTSACLAAIDGLGLGAFTTHRYPPARQRGQGAVCHPWPARFQDRAAHPIPADSASPERGVSARSRCG